VRLGVPEARERHGVFRAQLQSVLEQGDGAVELPHADQRLPGIEVDGRLIGVAGQHGFVLFESLGVPAAAGELDREVVACFQMIGIPRQHLLVVFHRLVAPSLRGRARAQHDHALQLVGIELERLPGHPLRLVVLAGPVEQPRQVAQGDRLHLRVDLRFDASRHFRQHPFLPALLRFDCALGDQRAGERRGEDLVALDRRVRMVEEKLGAGNAVAEAALSRVGDDPHEIDDRIVLARRHRELDVPHDAQLPQRADVLVAGDDEMLASLFVSLLVEENVPEVVVGHRPARVERHRLLQQRLRVAETAGPAGPPGVRQKRLAARDRGFAHTECVLALEGRRVLEVRRHGDEHEPGVGVAGDARHAVQIEPVVLDNAALQRVIASVGRKADRGVEQCVDLAGHPVLLAGRGPAIRPHGADRGAHDGIGARPADHRPEPGDARIGLDEAGVRASFEEFVVPRVDDESVGLEVCQFLHERRFPVAGIAHAAGVDHFPVPAGIDARQHLAQPAAVGGEVVVRVTVSRRPPEAEDAERVLRLGLRKLLRIEVEELVARGMHHGAAVGRLLLDEERQAGDEADVRIFGLDDGSDP
jgi:hypothetical protein